MFGLARLAAAHAAGTARARLAAMIFAVHPVGVESVAWATATGTVVTCTLCLASMLAFWRSSVDGHGHVALASTRRTSALYALAIGLYIAALFGDQASVALPAVLLVVLWWKHGRLTRRELACVAPFAVLAFLAIVVHSMVQGSADVPHLAARGTSITSSAIVAGRSFWFYAGKLLWPDPLVFIYPRWEIRSSLWWQFLPVAAAIAVVAALWRCRAHWPRPLCRGAHFRRHAAAASLCRRVARTVRHVRGRSPSIPRVAGVLRARVGGACCRNSTSCPRHNGREGFGLDCGARAPCHARRATNARLSRSYRSTTTHSRVTPRHGWRRMTWRPAHWENGRLDQAIQAEQQAIEVLDGRRRDNPSHGDDADALAGCHERLAALLEQIRKAADASIVRDQAIAIREELVRQQPDVPEYHDHLAWSYIDRAFSLRDQGKFVDALPWFRLAVAQRETGGQSISGPSFDPA